MKTKLIIITLLIPLVAWASTLTIEINNNDVPRLTEAFGSILNLGRPANQTEIENAVRRWLKESTLDYERRKDMAAFSPPPLETTPAPTPTPTP